MNDVGDQEKGSGTNSAKHPKGRWRLLVPDPFSATMLPNEGSNEDMGRGGQTAGDKPMTETNSTTLLLNQYEIAQVILDHCQNSQDRWSLKPNRNHRPVFHAAHRYGHANFQAIMHSFRSESWLTTIRNWDPEDPIFRVQQYKRRQRISLVAAYVAESERSKQEQLLSPRTTQAESA